jgi:hypothetical protein
MVATAEQREVQSERHEKAISKIKAVIEWLESNGCAHAASGEWRYGQVDLTNDAFDEKFRGCQVERERSSFDCNIDRIKVGDITFKTYRFAERVSSKTTVTL